MKERLEMGEQKNNSEKRRVRFTFDEVSWDSVKQCVRFRDGVDVFLLQRKGKDIIFRRKDRELSPEKYADMIFQASGVMADHEPADTPKTEKELIEIAD